MDQDENLKRCPRCAEEIRQEATRCRHCQHDFDTSQGELISNWVRSHPTVTVSLLTFLFVTFQVYKVADFEINVELIRTGGLTSILTGVLLQELPFMILLLTFFACWWLMTLPPRARPTETRGSPRRTINPRTMPQLFIAGLLVVAFYAIPWPLFAVALVSVIAALAIAPRRKPAGGRAAKVVGTFMASMGLILIGWLLYTHPVVWVPSENVTTTDRGTVVAYVIAQDDRFTTLLTPQWTGYLSPGENSVVKEPTDRITARELCSSSLLEAKVFGRVLRLRPIQIIDVLRFHALPEPSQRRVCGGSNVDTAP